MMEEYRLELEGRQMTLRFSDLLSGTPLVEIDGKRIYQAINNIVRNAIEHGPDQGLTLDVVLNRKEEMIAIDIADNGPGIPADKLPHIFDRFYRVDTARTKHCESTGLGLAISRELIEAHGGEIAVASTPGAGSCFTVLLPESEQERESQ
jgi:signal transduction histidine kinase